MQFINFTKYLKVTAVISACYYNLQMEIPIIIGAYPVTNQSAESLPDYYGRHFTSNKESILHFLKFFLLLIDF